MAQQVSEVIAKKGTEYDVITRATLEAANGHVWAYLPGVGLRRIDSKQYEAAGDYIDPIRDHGADPTGASNSTPAFQAAHDQGETERRIVKKPRGSFRLPL
jgi:hypothetical protein